jgi:hypothetical protein
LLVLSRALRARYPNFIRFANYGSFLPSSEYCGW